MFWLRFKFPPVMIIDKKPDGTIVFRGTASKVLDFIARALNIK